MAGGGGGLLQLWKEWGIGPFELRPAVTDVASPPGRGPPSGSPTACRLHGDLRAGSLFSDATAVIRSSLYPYNEGFKGEDIFKLLEMELSLMYDTLYTKAPHGMASASTPSRWLPH